VVPGAIAELILFKGTSNRIVLIYPGLIQRSGPEKVFVGTARQVLATDQNISADVRERQSRVARGSGEGEGEAYGAIQPRAFARAERDAPGCRVASRAAIGSANPSAAVVVEFLDPAAVRDPRHDFVECVATMIQWVGDQIVAGDDV